MTQETIKEIGKLSIDLAKITFAIAILTPLIKTGNIDYKALLSALGFAISGIILINKGTTENEWYGKYNFRIKYNYFYFCNICKTNNK